MWGHRWDGVWMWDGFKAEQEACILPSLTPCSTQGHSTASPLLGALGAIRDPGWVPALPARG